MKKLVILLAIIMIFSLVSAEQKISSDVIDNFQNSDTVKVIINYNDSLPLPENQIKYSNGTKASALISEDDILNLESNPNVSSIELIPTKSLFLNDAIQLTNSTNVWNFQLDTNITGLHQTACVIDSGVNYLHADLGGCFGNNDPTSDCKVLGGWDYCSDDVNCVSEDSDPIDVNGHGTFVSGVISANGTLKGIAPDSKLIVIKASNSTGTFWDDDVEKAIRWCINNATKFNITVISMSLGGGIYTSYCDNVDDPSGITSAIDDAIANNISVTIATGNDESTSGIGAPSCIQNATRVGSISKSNTISSFTNRNSFFTDILMSYGQSIQSTYNSGYATGSGTSFSTPMVTGMILLLEQYELYHNTNITSNHTKQVIINSSDTVFDSSTSTNFSIPNSYNIIKYSDQYSPTVSLISPSGGVGNETNQTFNCNVTDDLKLSNVTLTIWNSTGIFYQNTTNVSTNSISIQENVTLNNSNYEWNCLAYDFNNNTASNSNLTVNSILSTNLYYPSNESSTNNLTNFTCNSSSIYELTNVTFNLWNSTMDLIYNETQNISGTTNTTTFTYNFTSEGNYSWNCVSEDSSNNSISSISNYSISYDSIAPTVSLVSPTSGYSATGTQSIAFQYNVSDNSSITSCSLFLNGNSVSTESSITLNSQNEISYSVSPGSYSWIISCEDSAGNEGNSSPYSLTINTVTSSSSSSGGGSSSSGGGGGSSEIILSETQIIEGYTKDLFKNSEVSFPVNGESQKIIIKNISNNSVSLSVSNNILDLKLNEIRKLDLNNDNYYDLEIWVLNLTSTKAEIRIKEIYEAIPTKETYTPESPEPETTTKIVFFERIANALRNFLRKLFSLPLKE